MASRKKLKHTIQYVSSELITYVHFQRLVSEKIDNEKVDNLIAEIIGLNREFVKRANRPDGKNNPQLVKAYFRKLFADWQTAMEKVNGEIESL